MRLHCLAFVASLLLAPGNQVQADDAPRPRVSGISPHLAMFNEESECGTGAVVPWADRLWAITYAPHKPKGSTDKLYEITDDLEQIIRPESIGGTPANRLIHRESQQLFIGPYVIDAARNVRVITPEQMFGRHTGTARHLFDPAGKVYFATMEEGFYEVDVKTLAVKELWADEQVKAGRHADLPGYHGKGFYSGQGRIVYSNNGEHGPEALKKPDIPSGVLAEWDGRADKWTVVRRNQFTEVTGPGGIEGNPNPEADPIWSVGWDHRSLIVNVLDAGKWTSFRLPKTSHSYDGAHGWNTEWPRIRDIGEDDLLMTMHGAFWRFPRTFSAKNSAGIRPRSSYLKVVGDFCRWRDHVVLGCDDTAKSEFLNKRKLKGEVAGPGQSQSNLWFLKPEQLDQLGPVLGRGAVWLKDDVKAGEPSDPYLIAGYERKSLHLAHAGETAITFDLEIDPRGTGEWTKWKSVEVAAKGNVWLDLADAPPAEWLRLISRSAGKGVTAFFHSSNVDRRGTSPDAMFAGFEAKTADSGTSLLHVRGANYRTLRCVDVSDPDRAAGDDLNADLELRPSGDREGAAWVKAHCTPPRDVISVDDASVVYVDEQHRLWRLPRQDASLSPLEFPITERVCREVCTERDLLNVEGTLYELPAENAGGFARIRPIASHGKFIADFATYRGLLVMAGRHGPGDKAHVPAGSSAGGLWLGAVDDLWKFGKPRGHGGPWRKTAVIAHQPSDPYLMTGYDRKELVLFQRGAEKVHMTVEVDFTGNGDWTRYQTFEVGSEPVRHSFPEAFAAYWVRVVPDHDCVATALFKYE
ncbi:hypothetical protein Pan44_23530 [Caulifigura coniformis]|uniref:Uncharacterized protein n=1 Tax=Caulifigura coniformis TaxID=2527983 RepID=A0A517SDX1_9PLAN|nr:hypothetical protein [Caulifigura coniformis]QDT54324.1 hypothetical protein Pan44_23530 [Caulifigura coniformis]